MITNYETYYISTLRPLYSVLTAMSELNLTQAIDKNYDLNTMVQRLVGTLYMDQKSNREIDQDLIEQVKKGDKTAFKQIYSRFSQVTYNLALRILKDKEDAEEVVQEIFLQIWNKAYSYDPDRGAVSTWVVNIARSRSIDKLRTVGYRNKNVEIDEEKVNSNVDLSRTIEDRDESKQVIKKALDSLPDKQRIAIELVYFGGLTHIEAAEELEEPVGTIKTRIRLGVMKLKDKIMPYIEDLN
ncbi:MAG: sigma-70 family RNA polymerase sigma factor [Thermodesulfobacteriota bacterium]